MPFFVDDPRHWRERAAEARKIADGLTDPIAKRSMVEVVSAYERMAERAELRTHRAPESDGRDGTAPPALLFPRRECSWDFGTRTVRFWGNAAGKAVPCRIAVAALQDHFHLGDDSSAMAMEAFASGRPRIEGLAAQKWAAGAVEPDGSLLLRAEDF